MSVTREKPCLKRASTKKLRSVFEKYVSVEENGEKYITIEDFLTKYLNIFPTKNFNQDSLLLFAGALKTKRSGLISFAEFQAFEELLCLPDALYKVAFQLFDINGNGQVSFYECERILVKTELYKHIPFDLNNSLFDLYFGKRRRRTIDYSEFTQFLHDFHEQYVIETFRSHDNLGDGFIKLEDFKNIMINTKKHLLTPDVESHLIETAKTQQTNQNVSFPYFIAFNSMLNNTELMKKIYLYATNGDESSEVTKENFIFSAQNVSQVTPLQADILFKLCETIHGSNGKIVYKDLNMIAPEVINKEIVKPLYKIQLVSSLDDRDALIQTLESIYRLCLGMLASAIGAFVVQPLDFIKTTLQNQRISPGTDEVLYTGIYDCFRKILREKGVLGFYRGVVPQILGIAPDKAIKLAANDFTRDRIQNLYGSVPLWGDITAATVAGIVEVIVANPFETVKIRLQTSRNVEGKKLRAITIIKELGIIGLYSGWRATVLRNIVFGSIFFTSYVHLKRFLADENGYNNPNTLLIAGFISALPAAGFGTPFDVIKTRLQAKPVAGQTSYSGVVDAIWTIGKQEGSKAFWKGAGARMLRSGPQFSITLLTYEIFQRIFYIDFGGYRPEGSKPKVKTTTYDMDTLRYPDHIGGYQIAKPIFLGIEKKFGLCLPKFGISPSDTEPK